jgi:hypothetical protein
MLKRQARCNRTGASIKIALAAGFVIWQKDFVDRAIGKPANGCGVSQTADLE